MSLIGLPANTLSLSGNITATYNSNAGAAVSETVNVDSNPADAIQFFAFGFGVTSGDPASSLTLSISSFVTIMGDFGFQTASSGGISTLAVAAENVSAATLAVGGVALNIDDASLGMLIVTANTSGSGPLKGTYALVANGGNDSLTGIPGLSFTASGLAVLVNDTGAVPGDLPGGSQSIETPDGSLSLGFGVFGTSAATITELSGTISLNIANLVALSGNFFFEETTPIGGSTEIIAGASDVDATFGTASTNLTISDASLSLLVVPGASGASTNYALIASGGTDKLNGIPGVSLTASGLTAEVNTGLSSTLLMAADNSGVQTPGGQVTINFDSLAALGSAPIKVVEGTIGFNIDNAITLSGTFAVEQFTDGTTGLTDTVIGASNVDAMLGRRRSRTLNDPRSQFCAGA